MNKICKGCRKQFKTNNEGQVYCSKNCKNRYMATPKYKKEISKMFREVMNRPEVKKKQVKAIKRALNKPGMHEKMSKICKIIQNKLSVKRKIKNKLTSFYKDKKRSKKECEKRSKRMKKIWKNKKSRNKRIKIFREAYKNNIEAKNKISKSKLSFWKNAKNAEKMFISKYKDYKMPSGKIVKIQGYEDKALSILLKKFKESDIVVGVKEINKTIGKIIYKYDNKEHRYYPDIYIKSQNKIIEVKSKWSYKLHLTLNRLKKKASKKHGFNFEFMIF